MRIPTTGVECRTSSMSHSARFRKRRPAFAALETEEIGLLLDLPLDAADRIEEDADLQVLGRPGNRLYRLTFGTLIDTPIAEAAVRRALQYAIDVDSIIAGPLEGAWRSAPRSGA